MLAGWVLTNRTARRRRSLVNFGISVIHPFPSFVQEMAPVSCSLQRAARYGATSVPLPLFPGSGTSQRPVQSGKQRDQSGQHSDERRVDRPHFYRNQPRFAFHVHPPCNRTCSFCCVPPKVTGEANNVAASVEARICTTSTNPRTIWSRQQTEGTGAGKEETAFVRRTA